jgi:hypothetical protein
LAHSLLFYYMIIFATIAYLYHNYAIIITQSHLILLTLKLLITQILGLGRLTSNSVSGLTRFRSPQMQKIQRTTLFSLEHNISTIKTDFSTKRRVWWFKKVLL